VAPEVQSEGLLIDEYLIDAPTRTFLLTVRGESMRDAGLLPGDTVVVKRGAIPAIGDIVVAALRGEMTVKQLAQEDRSSTTSIRPRTARSSAWSSGSSGGTQSGSPLAVLAWSRWQA
jgi:hypothetical protein